LEAPDVVRELLELGADPRIADNDGETALFVAVASNRLKTVQCFVEKEVDVNQANEKRVSPLHLACKIGALEICRVLVANQAKIAAVDNERRTPLHYATLKNNLEIVTFLLENDADPLARDLHGKSPFSLASPEVAAALRDNVQERVAAPTKVIDVQQQPDEEEEEDRPEEEQQNDDEQQTAEGEEKEEAKEEKAAPARSQTSRATSKQVVLVDAKQKHEFEQFKREVHEQLVGIESGFDTRLKKLLEELTDLRRRVIAKKRRQQ
jgi:ankyrin repeat protein